MPNRRLLVRMLAAALVGLPITFASARAEDPSAMSCPQLWHSKNAMLKAHGFCFSDPRAIRTFGNDGCSGTDPNRVALTAAERQMMARIVISERLKLCR